MRRLASASESARTGPDNINQTSARLLTLTRSTDRGLESLEGLRGSLQEVADQAKADREALVAQLKADSIVARRRARRRFRLGLVASVPIGLLGTYIASRLGLH
jgi:hypothetical protein